MSKMQSTLGGINCRVTAMSIAEDRISEFENIPVRNSLNETSKTK